MESHNSQKFFLNGARVNTLDRLYEMLGVRSGVTREELKTAYRDLTKVWHPDRFTHDPRLQEKAQEKLKEINDAYEQIISGKIRQPSVTQKHSDVADYSERWNARSPVAARKSTSSIRILIVLILFSSMFVFTIRFLHTKANRQAETLVEEQAAGTVIGNSAKPNLGDATPARVSNETSLKDSRAEEQSMPTVTVVIDSTTGLLARPECSTKIRMTYPSGNEPHSYCNLHPANSASNPNHQSKFKSLKSDSSSDESNK